MPAACSRPASSNLTVITRYFPLFEQDKSAANHFFCFLRFRCLYPIHIMAYRLMWLTLITITTGTYLMNEYIIIKVQKGKSIPLICLLTYLAKPESTFLFYLKYFLRFCKAAWIQYSTARTEHFSRSAISLYVMLSK